MKIRKYCILVLGTVSAFYTFNTSATLIGFPNCTGANACTITNSPPNPVTQDPNDGILLAWDEVQNFTLTQNLRVDRVFDSTASFVTSDGFGGFIIAAGTIVSSHYFQWDPGNGSSSRVDATIATDSQAFAFITTDQKLFGSDFLGLASIDYNDFGLRGLEINDTTNFNGDFVNISWNASSPGDWTRMITAFSPAAVVPVPAAVWLFGSGLLGLVGIARRKQH